MSVAHFVSYVFRHAYHTFISYMTLEAIIIYDDTEKKIVWVPLFSLHFQSISDEEEEIIDHYMRQMDVHVQRADNFFRIRGVQD